MQNIMRIIGTMGVHYLMKVTLLFLIIAFKIILLSSEIQSCLFVICLGFRKYSIAFFFYSKDNLPHFHVIVSMLNTLFESFPKPGLKRKQIKGLVWTSYRKIF